jgi:hypothetical protein
MNVQSACTLNTQYYIILPQNMASECKLTDVIAERIGKVVLLEQKFNMFDKTECGESIGYIGRHFHIDESSVTI